MKRLPFILVLVFLFSACTGSETSSETASASEITLSEEQSIKWRDDKYLQHGRQGDENVIFGYNTDIKDKNGEDLLPSHNYYEYREDVNTHEIKMRFTLPKGAELGDDVVEKEITYHWVVDGVSKTLISRDPVEDLAPWFDLSDEQLVNIVMEKKEDLDSWE